MKQSTKLNNFHDLQEEEEEEGQVTIIFKLLFCILDKKRGRRSNELYIRKVKCFINYSVLFLGHNLLTERPISHSATQQCVSPLFYSLSRPAVTLQMSVHCSGEHHTR